MRIRFFAHPLFLRIRFFFCASAFLRICFFCASAVRRVRLGLGHTGPRKRRFFQEHPIPRRRRAFGLSILTQERRFGKKKGVRSPAKKRHTPVFRKKAEPAPSRRRQTKRNAAISCRFLCLLFAGGMNILPAFGGRIVSAAPSAFEALDGPLCL